MAKGDDQEFLGGEQITINDGSREIKASRKAFESIYINQGWSEGKLGSQKAAAAKIEAAGSTSGRASAAGAGAKLTPQQKAAQTKAANAAKKAAEAGDGDPDADEDPAGDGDPDADEDPAGDGE